MHIQLCLKNSQGRKNTKIQRPLKIGRQLLLDHLNGSTVISFDFCRSNSYHVTSSTGGGVIASSWFFVFFLNQNTELCGNCVRKDHFQESTSGDPGGGPKHIHARSRTHAFIYSTHKHQILSHTQIAKQVHKNHIRQVFRFLNKNNSFQDDI